MINKEDCFNIGYISKRVGNYGDIALLMDVDNPLRYKKLESIFLEIDNSLIPYFITKIIIKGTVAVITIEGIDSIERAQALIKRTAYLPLTMLPPLEGKKFYFHEIVGYSANDKHYGDIGKVEKVLEFPQQTILQIKYLENELLIPAKDEFIVTINRELKTIYFDCPEGLLAIYINPTDDETEKESE